MKPLDNAYKSPLFPENPIDSYDDNFETYLDGGSASSQECTGMQPIGGYVNSTEQNAYDSIYEFLPKSHDPYASRRF
ncbi:hypothetical protein FACS1894132_00280 [Clostridia bacterium]|nr:hypothetical protein FACS1894132_00280 [Clostridia bacterium]